MNHVGREKQLLLFLQFKLILFSQDTDMMLRLANYSMLEGKYGDAMKKFVEVLKLFDSTLVPPYKSYYDCVQNLRRCMLSLGNYSIV